MGHGLKPPCALASVAWVTRESGFRMRDGHLVQAEDLLNESPGTGVQREPLLFFWRPASKHAMRCGCHSALHRDSSTDRLPKTNKAVANNASRKDGLCSFTWVRHPLRRCSCSQLSPQTESMCATKWVVPQAKHRKIERGPAARRLLGLLF